MDGDQAGLVHPREFFLTEPGALRVRAPPRLGKSAENRTDFLSLSSRLSKRLWRIVSPELPRCFAELVINLRGLPSFYCVAEPISANSAQRQRFPMGRTKRVALTHLQRSRLFRRLSITLCCTMRSVKGFSADASAVSTQRFL